MLYLNTFHFLDEIHILNAEGEPEPCHPIVSHEFDLNIDAVAISLDASMSSDLNWKEAQHEAAKATKNGSKIFWKFHFDLLSDLALFLSDPIHHQTLALSVQHFKQTLWEEFHKETLAVSLYEGPLDLLSYWKWDLRQEADLQKWLKERCLDGQTPAIMLATKEGRHWLRLFCRDIFMQHLDVLASYLPGGLTTCVLLEANGFEEPVELVQLLQKECYSSLSRAVACKPALIPVLLSSYKGVLTPKYQTIAKTENVSLGICLPDVFSPADLGQFQSIALNLTQKKIPFRMIHESQLTQEWDGLDYILVASLVTAQGERKLRGFCAAGGKLLHFEDLDLWEKKSYT